MSGSHRHDAGRQARRPGGRATLLSMIAVLAVAVGGYVAFTTTRPSSTPNTLPTAADSYLGVYVPGIPHSYRPVRAFVGRTGVRPNVLLYYSSWWEPFREKFAATAAVHHAIPLVQINPEHVRLSAIAAGRYDTYIQSFAAAIRAYRRPVIVGFGHEMNAQWSKWGYRHARPATFVAAWRHIVSEFRMVGVGNVTWLWTVNVIDAHANSLPPGRWWPGDRYVDWVGIDGYYRRPAWRFAALFGPTIKAVHQLTGDPILISETGVAPRAGKAAKISNLFAGIKAYGLLGVVWFDAVAHQDWRLNNHAAIDAFYRAAVGTDTGQ
jgi:mannan endo-1,4-beta-mannosidase